MALIDLRQVKDGVQLKQNVETNKQEINTLKTTTIPGEVRKLEGKIALKADSTALQSAKEELEGKINKKADQAAMTEALKLKADTATVDEKLALKADTETVNASLETKAVKADVERELGLKATKEELTQKLATKAEKSHRHAHTEIDGLGDVATKNVGTSEGNVPVLGRNGKLDTSVLPSIAINEYFTATNKTTAMDQAVQNGDIISLTEEDEGITYITVNASAETFQERFRPLTSVTDVVSKGELTRLLEAKADKSQVTLDINAAKAAAIQAGKDEAGKVNTALEAAKRDLQGKIDTANGKISTLEEKDRTNSATIASHTQKITALEAKDREIEGKVTGNTSKIQKLEESVNGLKGIVEHTQEFTATNNQTAFVVTNPITDDTKVKVFVNGLKALKKEYTVDKAQKTITWKPDIAQYQIGEGFLVEIVYC